MVKISITFGFLCLAAVRCAENFYAGGYNYHVPSVPFHSASNHGPNMNFHQIYNNNAQQKQNKFLPSTTYSYMDYIHRNQQQQTQQQSIFNNHGYNAAQTSYQTVDYNGYNQYNGNANLQVQSGQQTAHTAAYNPNVVNTPQRPVITKHIYFHLPPAEEAITAAPVTAPPPKKTYNIVFIKLPSQKSANAARLQQIINQQAASESKTLIYVLVKKPQTYSTETVTSKPEVFFVKYKDPRKLATQVNNGLVQVPVPVQNIERVQTNLPVLLPGLINGNGN